MSKKKPIKKTKPKEPRLSAKQEAFVREYLIDLNASAAARRAGYSEKTAGAIGDENLEKPQIRKAIDEAKIKRAITVEVSANDVLAELVKLAKSDIRKVWNEDGSLKPMTEWPEEIAGCVASVEVDELFEWEKDEDGDRKSVV